MVCLSEEKIELVRPENYLEDAWKKVFKFLFWLGKKMMELSMRFGKLMFEIGKKQSEKMDKV